MKKNWRVFLAKAENTRSPHLLNLPFTIPRVLFGGSLGVVVVVGIKGGRMPCPWQTRRCRSAELLLFAPSSAGTCVTGVTRLSDVGPVDNVTRCSSPPVVLAAWYSTRNRVVFTVCQRFSAIRLAALLAQGSSKFRIGTHYPDKK